MVFQDFSFELIRKAVNLYVQIAFPHGFEGNLFNKNLIQRAIEVSTLEELLSIFTVEKIPQLNNEFRKKYSLQLGSDRYPFLKLALVESSIEGVFGFLVDRHTEFLARRSSMPTYKEELEVKNYTNILKHEIEEAWIQNYVPTYRQIVREKIEELRTYMKTQVLKDKKAEHILVVEDDEDLRTLFELELNVLGYVTDTAENGEVAIEKIANGYYDLVLLDLMMPNMSGFEVLERVSNEVKVVVISAISDSYTKNECVFNGAIEVLTKPVNLEVLDYKLCHILTKANV